ncbi:hypothetical protein [Nocardioides mangrovi]|uniref:Uncharacterized protein n=1 Tax=Nocardioides mangrovi TaxID=2874580 RepID=A0ABS7U9R7_9ACTN|nr:hypothetical protein [Nocardioides mangrovi]MBZ5737725.1 hypothetical protein [Nocardioides mangrovi]
MSGLNPEKNPEEELRASNSNQHGDDGTRDVSEHERDPDEETLPEQSVGNPEDNPDGVPPKAGYPSKDPRSQDHPYRTD